MLNHATRGLVYDHIRANPGAHYREIMRQLGLAQGTLTHHLYVLERGQAIHRRRQGLRMRFYPDTQRMVEAVALHEWQIRLLRLARERPHCTQTEAAATLGLTRQALHYHVNHLRERDLLIVAPDGRQSRLRAAPAAAERVGACPACGAWFDAPAHATAAIRCPGCGKGIQRRNTDAADP